MTDERGVESLATALSASTAADRATAAEALAARAESDPAAVATVATELDTGVTHVDARVRTGTTAALAEAADANAAAVAPLAGHLGDRLDDEELAVCHHAAYALARVGAVDPGAVESAVPALARATHADDDSLSRLAVHAVAAVADTDPTVVEGGDTETAARLQAGLVTALGDDDDSVRRRAGRALARLVECGAVAPPEPTALVPLATDDDPAARRDATFLSARAADAEPTAVLDTLPTIADRLSDHGAVTVHAVAALSDAARVAPERVVDSVVVGERITPLLRHDRPDVRANAALTLGRVVGETSAVADSVDTLAERLVDSAPVVRANAAFALAALAEVEPDAARPAMEPLLGRLEDDEEREQVRIHAGTALDTLRSELSPAPSPVSAAAADDGVPRGAAAATDGERGVGRLDTDETGATDETSAASETRDETSAASEADAPEDGTREHAGRPDGTGGSRPQSDTPGPPDG